MAARKTATVTGVTGFVASELIKQLLERGYAVKATARCAPTAPQLAPLLAAANGAPGSLEVVQVASLLRRSPELDAALAGSTYVFHVASPFRFDGDPVKDIIEPAVEGTRAVLEAAAATDPRPKRVVVTSSVCAIHDQHQKQTPAAAAAAAAAAQGAANSSGEGDAKQQQEQEQQEEQPDQAALYSERDWNAVSTPEAEPYWVSKVRAERLAWELAGALGLDVVTILPNFVLGPVVGPGAPAAGVSAGFMKQFLEAPGGQVPEGAWTICDVRDVAAAHVAAAERPGAKGRYIVSLPGSLDARAVTDALKGALPGAAEGLPDGQRAATKVTIDAGKLRAELGVEPRPARETVVDAARSLLEHGVARPAWWRGGGGNSAAAAATVV